jgi:hypothetical protein
MNRRNAFTHRAFAQRFPVKSTAAITADSPLHRANPPIARAGAAMLIAPE